MFAACWLVMVTYAHAQPLMPGDLNIGEGPMTMTADEVIYWRVEDRYIARGNVVVKTPRFTITCDEIEVWNETGTMHARGNVRIVGRDIDITTDSIEISSKSEEGVIVNATLFIAEPHTEISGNKIEKIGEGTYLIQGASFTTCKCEEGELPDWSIHARTIEAEEDGYARARNATFRVKNLPIFYLPYAVMPIQIGRASCRERV